MNTANIVLKPINSEYNRTRGTYRELALYIDALAGEELDEKKPTQARAGGKDSGLM